MPYRCLQCRSGCPINTSRLVPYSAQLLVTLLSYTLRNAAEGSSDHPDLQNKNDDDDDVCVDPLRKLTHSNAAINLKSAMALNGSRPRNIQASDFPEERKHCLLFHCREMEHLAHDIARVSDHVTLGEISWNRFEDGFPNIFVKNALHIRNRHVAFLASFHSSEAIFEQISVIYALPRLFVKSFTLVLPFFPTGTQERVELEGEVATAFTLARILSDIPLSRGGPTTLVTYDIHALQERFYFGDAVLPLFESGIPLFLKELSRLEDINNVTIAYPDDGAWKRFHTYFNGYPEIICTKIRLDGKKIVKIKEGDATGRHVIMVDDLVQTGGTLIECKSVLMAHGAKHVSAYVTHGVFPQQSWKKFTPEHNNSVATGFKYLWMTDSCSETVRQVKNRPPFKILSLADAIAQTLQI